MQTTANPKNFYEDIFDQPYVDTGFAHSELPEDHPYYHRLKRFIAQHDLTDRHCLEVGSGYGAMENLVSDYTGIDIAFSAANHLHSPFTVASGTALPFPDHRFDFVWSNYILEHVRQPELMLAEMWRVLKPGGFLFLSAAWQCGPWLANGYPDRPYADFDLRGKLIKASVPIRKTIIFRSFSIFPSRFVRLLAYLNTREPTKLRYRQLEPNYIYRWMPDSAAENSLDPFEVYMWYISRNAICLNYPTVLAGFLIKNGPLTFRRMR